MGSDNLKSLIQTITSDQVADLIDEYNLFKEGYKFYYFVDTFDINRLCFPFGIVAFSSFDENEKDPIEIITDKQLSYNYLLRQSDFYFLLFDEYYVEYMDFKNKIDRAKYLGLELVNSLKILVDYYDESIVNNKLSLEKFQTVERISEFQVSLLLSIVVGTISNGIDKLNNLEQSQLIHSLNDLNKLKGFNNELSDIINDCQPSDFTDQIFHHLIERFSKNIILEPDRLRARYTDCKVYDRLVHINNKTLNIDRTGFFLLSSTKTSGKISNIANEFHLNPKFKKNSVFNPFRSINQIYLKLLLEKSPNYINDLLLIKNLVRYKEKDINKADNINKLIVANFENRINELREGFENAALIKDFKDYREEIEKSFENKEIIKSKHVIPSLKKLILLSLNTDVIEQTRNKKLNDLIFERTYKTSLVLGIEKIKQGFSQFEICQGDDYITNHYHHLPLVYFIEENDVYQDAINEIVKFLTEIEPKRRNSQALIKSINKSLELLFDRAKPNFAENLIRLLILTLLRTKDDKEPEMIAYKSAIQILNSNKSNKNFRKEYLYFLSWIARRNLDYKTALDYAEEGINIDNTDPRFYQSISLIKYCLFRETKEKVFLVESIYNAKKSIDLYSRLKIESLAVEKSMMALFNTICFLSCLFYEDYEKQIHHLNLARENIEKLKKMESNFDKIPEFLHTEANLIKLEISSQKENPDLKKLEYAKSKIEYAIKMNPKEIYKELKLELDQMLNKYS